MWGMDQANHVSNTATPALSGWAPFPPNGKRCQHTGLTHGRAYSLFLKGPARKFVRSVSLAEPGKRGTRLFNVADALAYLDRLSREQAAAAGSEAVQ
jgi:hypothetical protein